MPAGERIAVSQKKLVAGLDLARRRDHIALALLDVEAAG